MTALLSRLLAELEEMLPAATPGEWSNPEYTSSIYGGDPAHLLRVASGVHPADAALIVAAVNAVGPLTTAARVCLAARDALEQWGDDLTPEQVRALRRSLDESLPGVMTPASLGVMTPKRMKVRLVVTVEVDPGDWMDVYGCERDEVREDVRSYFTDQIGQASAVEDAGLTVRVS